jgi:hypothetical protein
MFLQQEVMINYNSVTRITLFTSKEQIQELIGRADDSSETKRLINKFKELKNTRVPFYLTLGDFDEVLLWKLRRQYGRQLKFRERNTDSNIQVITKAAFLVEHSDKNYETELRLKLLVTLSGVEVPVASAILTLCFPDKYSVIDFRNWGQIFGKNNEKTNYTTKEYIMYLSLTKQLASDFEVTPQEIDMAIWQYDIETSSK